MQPSPGMLGMQRGHPAQFPSQYVMLFRAVSLCLQESSSQEAGCQSEHCTLILASRRCLQPTQFALPQFLKNSLQQGEPRSCKHRTHCHVLEERSHPCSEGAGLAGAVDPRTNSSPSSLHFTWVSPGHTTTFLPKQPVHTRQS